MKHYHFVEEISGEEFLVGADDFSEAYDIANDVAKEIGDTWNDGKYELTELDVLSNFWAECSGLDEY